MKKASRRMPCRFSTDGPSAAGSIPDRTSRSVVQRLGIDIGHWYGYMPFHPVHGGAFREGTFESGTGAVLGDAVIRRVSGRFWASSRPALDRTARCSLHWRRGGSSRLHPVIPGSAARGRVGGSNLRRMTAVGRRKARAPPLCLPRVAGQKRWCSPHTLAGFPFCSGADSSWCAYRRSASLFFEGGDWEGLS